MNGTGSGRAQAGSLQADPLADLHEVLRATRPGADTVLIRRAYDVAAAWHHGQTRMSGDPHITHPLAVATILARLGADDQTLCAALLHDVIDYTPCTLAELSRDFGAEIAALVAGIAALDQIKARRGRGRARALAAARSADTRALTTMLADRLHNLRTVEFLPQEKQLRKARESLDFFVPAARLLSMDTVESELAALASATLRRNRHARTTSGRLLTAMTALLPAAARTRWAEEWLGELHTLPTRRTRARFAAHTLLGLPRLAVTLHRSTPGHR
jgi:guanosine-3',5'-bis(diphosphate) 3'-pyrophosphohydrolase